MGPRPVERVGRAADSDVPRQQHDSSKRFEQHDRVDGRDETGAVFACWVMTLSCAPLSPTFILSSLSLRAPLSLSLSLYKC
jgi:hypothetical protein